MTLDRIDAFCDSVPRYQARAEAYGPLTLFRRTGEGWPYYARPSRGATSFTAADVTKVRDRQRELGVPESFEWIAEITPGLRAAAEAAGLIVSEHPLMVLDQDGLPRDPASHVRLVGPDEPDLARIWAVPMVAFGAPGTAAGPDMTAELAAAVENVTEGPLTVVRERLRNGWMLLATAEDESTGPVSTGSCQLVPPVAEVTGVGTLPSERRRGLGAAVTAALTTAAFAQGAELVFLTAADDDVARMYGRLGFTRVGTSLIADAPA